MKLLDLLQRIDEAPLQTHQTIGDFNRSSSFRDPRDRRLLTNPKSVQRMKNMFSKTPHNFHFYFVNSPEANRHTEVGMIDREWLDKNMPKTSPEIPDHPDGITIIFTNNKGAARVPMTPWITAHRIGHAISRPGGYQGSKMQMQVPGYDKMRNEIMYATSSVMQYYGVQDFPQTADRLNFSSFDRNNIRQMQLIAKNFWQEIGTFRSARKKQFRDYFEFWNELVAQYLITGEIKFREAPRCFKSNRNQYCLPHDDPIVHSEVDTYVESMAGYANMEMNRMFESLDGKKFVM